MSVSDVDLSYGRCLTPFGGPYPLEKLTGSKDSGGLELGTVALELRRKCVEDPMFLLSEILSYGRADRKFFAEPTEWHVRAALAVKEQRSFLLLMPRNHGKTTLVDEGGTVWQFLAYPNDRVLFAQASIENAKGLSQQVRGHFVSNGALRALFPEYAMDAAHEAGNIMSWSVPCRTAITREKSLEIGTPESNLAGRHYDLVCASDIMNEQTTPPPAGVGTLEVMLKTVSWYPNTSFLLDKSNPRAHKRVDGTRYHDADLYGVILESPEFEHIVCGIEDDENGEPVPIWNKMGRRQLLEIRNSPGMTSAKWASQMRNDPLPPESSTSFRRDWFRTYTEVPENLSVAITVDPAFTKADKNRGADRTAIVVSGVDTTGHLYVLAWRAGRWSPRELLENLHSLIETWKPEWVGIESGTQSVSLKEMFFEDMQRTGRFVPYRDLKPKGQDKTVRAMPLLSHAERYGVFVRPGDTEFVDEFCRFPVGKHDDLVDALAYRAQDLYLPRALSKDTTLEEARKLRRGGAVPSEADTADRLMKRMDGRARERRSADAWFTGRRRLGG